MRHMMIRIWRALFRAEMVQREREGEAISIQRLIGLMLCCWDDIAVGLARHGS